MNPIVVSEFILALTLPTSTNCTAKQEVNHSILSKIDLSCIRQYYSDYSMSELIFIYWQGSVSYYI